MSGTWSRTCFHTQNWTWNSNATHVLSCKPMSCYCNSIEWISIYRSIHLFIYLFIYCFKHDHFQWLYFHTCSSLWTQHADFFTLKETLKKNLGSIISIYLGRISSPTLKQPGSLCSSCISPVFFWTTNCHRGAIPCNNGYRDQKEDDKTPARSWRIIQVRLKHVPWNGTILKGLESFSNHQFSWGYVGFQGGMFWWELF